MREAKTKQKISLYNLSSLIFVAIECILFVLIYTIFGRANDIISFCSIVVCLLFTLLFLRKNTITIISQVALLTTVVADLFLLVITPQSKTIAMTSFLITQICYYARLLYCAKQKGMRLIIGASVVCLVVIITCVVLKDKADYLSIVSMIYYTMLILNLIFSLVHFKVSPLFAIGIILFLCCDTIIGLNVGIGTYINVDVSSLLYRISHTQFNLAWIFYVPAQVLIALSIKDTEKVCHQ